MSDDDYDDDDDCSLRAIRERHLDGSIADDSVMIAIEQQHIRIYEPTPCVQCGRSTDCGELCYRCGQLEDMALEDLNLRRPARVYRIS